MKNKAVAVASLNAVAANLQVDMNDVVNVFISRHEDQLHSQRESLQKQMKEINSKIEAIATSVTGMVIAYAKTQLVSVKTELLSVKTELSKEDSVDIDWSKGHATYSVLHTVESETVKTGYNYRDSHHVPCITAIDQESVSRYKELMTEKAGITDQLTIVNNNLRDLARKERKVRGLIAEKKLSQIGMEDLLQDQQLLALIDDSSDK